MSIKIAILETIHETGVQKMREYAQVDHLEGIGRDKLLECLHIYDSIIVKSNINVDQELVEKASCLKVVGRAGVGVDNFDQQALDAKGIKLLTTPTGNTISTAEFTVSLILNLIRRMPEIQGAVGRNDYRRHLYEGRELSQMTVGILGAGNTGMTVAKRLSAFGCELMACDRTMRRKTLFSDLGGTMVETLDEMLEHIDILTLHIPSTPETYQIIDNTVFNKMKRNSYLINTARGNVVNEVDLIEALDNGRLAGAAVDVITPEPPYDQDPENCKFSHPIINHGKVIYTPHIAASTEDAQSRMSLQLAEMIKDELL